MEEPTAGSNICGEGQELALDGSTRMMLHSGLIWHYLEILDKCSSLFCQVIGDEKGLITLTPEDNVIKLFFVVTDATAK